MADHVEILRQGFVLNAVVEREPMQLFEDRYNEVVLFFILF